VRGRRQEQPDSVEAAVLAAGPVPADGTAAEWIFTRWGQESNLGYLLRHMGIGELTARGAEPYAAIAPELQDRQEHSRAHRRLTEDRQETNRELGVALVREHRESRRGTPGRQELIAARDRLVRQHDQFNARCERAKADGTIQDPARIEGLLEEAGELRADLRRLKSLHRRARKRIELEQHIDELSVRIDALDDQLRHTPHTESRLERLIEQGSARLHTTRKAFFDAVRITCCNIFLAAVDVLRGFYDNRRDDHVLLRALSRAPGFLTYRGGTLHIRLMPELNVPPKTLTALNAFCQEATILVNRTWAGRASPVHITVTQTPPHHLPGPAPPRPRTAICDL
jgi:hypothetical protein